MGESQSGPVFQSSAGGQYQPATDQNLPHAHSPVELTKNRKNWYN